MSVADELECAASVAGRHDCFARPHRLDCGEAIIFVEWCIVHRTRTGIKRHQLGSRHESAQCDAIAETVVCDTLGQPVAFGAGARQHKPERHRHLGNGINEQIYPLGCIESCV